MDADVDCGLCLATCVSKEFDYVGCLCIDYSVQAPRAIYPTGNLLLLATVCIVILAIAFPLILFLCFGLLSVGFSGILCLG